MIAAVPYADNYTGRVTLDPVKDPAGSVVTPPFPNSQEIIFRGFKRKDEVWLAVSANGRDSSSDFSPWEGPFLVR